MAASQAGNFNLQEFTDAGLLLLGGRLYTYAYGTTTQKVAYTDAAGTIPHTYTSDGLGGLYIALNARGEMPAPLYLVAGSYDITLKRADGSTVWTRRADGVEAVVTSFMTTLLTSVGASLIGFIQNGAGAVLRFVQNKLRETISVSDYGAICDGVTNDAAAVALAQTAAGKRPLLFVGICHIGTATIITSPIADTGEQIFSATSLVTIDNGREVRAAWFGAKPDNSTESAAPINRALVAAKNLPVLLDTGIYKTTAAAITFRGDATNGYMKLRGRGKNATYIDCYGAFSGIQSNQAQVNDHTELSGFTIRNKGTVNTQIAIDIGTIRQSVVRDINVEDFLIGAALQKNVDALGNYYNHISNVSVGMTGTPASSIGFQLGYSGGGHANPMGNANKLDNCAVAGAETGLYVNGTGNVAKAMTLIGCTRAIDLVAGLDNRIQAYVESQTAQSMGRAAAGCDGNTLDLFNDALNCTAFVDSGSNNITGNVTAGGLGYLLPARVLDTNIIDHTMVSKIGASFPVFTIKCNGISAGMFVDVTFAGSIQFTANWGGTHRWAVNQAGGGVPVITLVSSAGTNAFTVAAAADGTVTWSMTGDAVQPLIGQLGVSIHGVAAVSNNFGTPLVYARVP